ncbi:hypothetical protein L1049_027117 [Liquidambar formosana]|uniref:Man1/Src1-like C-terminal domain-containing protein n=1 Tax=Liquidambar formosana TaxID=63359 RepID=A0AAP0N6E2_LIQFO
MDSTPKKRPKPDSANPKSKHTNQSPNYSPSSSLNSFVEPPPNFFPSKAEFLRLITVIAIASSVAMACNFVVSILNRQPKPFCDSDVDFPDSLSDFCEPCPSNGECYQGKLECVHGYRKHGKSCVEDGDINDKAKKLSEWVQTRVCEAYAQLLCGGTGTVWVSEDEIWSDLDDHKLMENFGFDYSIYMHTKQRAMETISRLLETRMNFQGIKELKCPDLLAEHYKPFSCRIQQWLSKHALVLVPVFAVLVGCILLFKRVRRRHYLSIRAEELYHQVCDVLEENALMCKSVNGEGEPWVVASWLRDHLLFPRERKDPALWKKVEELVQEDSRLDRYPKLVKGESKVVWEWQVEGSLSSSRMRIKGDASKLKSTERKTINFDQQGRELRSGELLKC